MAELHDLTAHELSLGFRTRKLSPVEATKAALHRIESWERHINAMYLVDMAGAMKQAREAEKRWREGKPLSLLDGVPITIKENIATKGVPTPIGTAASPMTPAPADAPPAARVREAGCVILGKTTMPDFGMLASGVSSLHGISRNPWNLKRNTAGSSSGAGAALAAGYGPLALGTDIGGSVRLPAAYTGTFALKPSLGRVPIHPPYLGRVTGPMTRTVQDAAMLLNHLALPDARDYMALPYEDRDWARSLDGEAGPAYRPAAGYRLWQPAAAGSAQCRGRSGAALGKARRHHRADPTLPHRSDDAGPQHLLPGPRPGGFRTDDTGTAGQAAAFHRRLVPRWQEDHRRPGDARPGPGDGDAGSRLRRLRTL